MLIPDTVHPEQTIYYNGAIVLDQLNKTGSSDALDLYQQSNSQQDMSMPVFVLCLDWLFLLSLIEVDQKGGISLCT